MLLIMPALWANQVTRLPPFSAEYTLNRGSMLIGKVTVTLGLSDNGAYDYRAHTVLVGLVAFFRDDEITEQSTGRIDRTGVIPGHYSYHHKKKKKPRKIDLTFDWTTHQVTNNTGDSHWSMTVPQGAQDKFSQQLALMLALSKGEQNVQFKVADGGKLKTYRFRLDGKETIETPAGSFVSLRLARQKDDRPSKATFWLSPDLHYLPVKIVKKDKDGPYIMELSAIHWN